ncbi:MAG: hypothetical protein AB1591_00260 [Pseudomonadota bacterium]
MTVTIAFDLSLLYLVALNVIAILGYVLLLKHRARRQQDKTTKVTAAIDRYFRADGIEVGVEAIPRPGGRSYIAFVESEPMKRFRYSHIIEITLRMHVRHECGVELERVFWRFPIRGTGQAAEDAVRSMEASEQEQDEYIRAGLDLRKQKGYDISESSWEEFQKTLSKSDSRGA